MDKLVEIKEDKGFLESAKDLIKASIVMLKHIRIVNKLNGNLDPGER